MGKLRESVKVYIYKHVNNIYKRKRKILIFKNNW